MANHAWLRVPRVGLVAALCGLASGTALAGDETPHPHGTVTAFIVGLRQTVSESGERVLGEAARWLTKLELGTGAIRDLRPGFSALALEETRQAAIPVARMLPLGARDSETENRTDGMLAALHRQTRLGLQGLAEATVATADRGWSYGNAQSNLGAEIGGTALDPETYLAGNINRGPVTGAALAEHSLGERDIELGLPMPLLPNMHVTAARYWWGDRAFAPAVQGYRFGLTYEITQHLQFEGGRSEDTIHGVAGFFGLHYTVPLDTKRPPGVMPP
ncbi:MAG: hypothetical protein KGL11_09190 [Alphaproteobacteria bacterium]|nr:hypothetical protein [Alphaproteobacteria bacterium]